MPREVEAIFPAPAASSEGASDCRLASVALTPYDARFRMLFEESGSIMLLIEPSTGMIVNVNQAAAAFYGYARDQLIGLPISQINTLPSEETALERKRALREVRNHFNFRHRLACGEERDVEVYSSPIDVDGRQLLFSIVHDVSARTRAEAQLRDSEERYRLTFEQAAIGIVLVGFEGVILRSNARFAEILGYLPEELPGLTVQQIIEPDDMAERIGTLERIFSGAVATESAERRYLRKDGSLIWAKSTFSMQRDEQGRPLHFIVVIEDINARKQAETGLYEATERLTLAARAGGVGIFDYDIINNSLVWDEQMFELYGIPKAHFRGAYETWRDGLHPEDREQAEEDFNAALRGEKEFDTEFRVVWPDQSIHHIRGLALVKRAASGKALRMTGTNWEITAQKLKERQLSESEERYRATFEQAAVGIVHTSKEGGFLRFNARFAEIIGYPLEEVGSLTFQQITPPEELAENQQSHQQLWTDAASHITFEKRYIRKDRSLIWAKLTVSVLRDSEGRALHSITMVEDINALKASQEALRINETHYRTIFQTSLDGIAISQMSDGRYIDFNNAFLDLVGYTREEIIGRTSVELGSWVDIKDRQNIVEELRQKSYVRDAKVRYRRKNGELFWIQISSTVIEIGGVACLLSMVRNISDAKAAEDEIRNLAFYDHLTHLPNRRLLMDRLRQVLAASNRKNRKDALLLVGLDHFKTLNDSLGHETGDLLLQEVSRRLLLCVREADTVARLGGDEFAVILGDLSSVPEEAAAQAEIVGRKILAAVSKPHLLAGREWHTTCSIGINVFGDQIDAVNEVLPQADIAMDQAKAAGRNAIRFFAPALQAAVNARASMEVDLRRAIKARQFQLYYQPQVDRGSLVGAEALIRWIHPAHGVVPPARFITLAEATGLILPLGKWAQIAAWSDREETAHLTVAVNISAREFRQPDFVEQVLSALYRTGANPQQLKLELTESMLVDNIEAVIATMTELRSHGLRFSLDDFGTGYSSLAYLRRLPLDQLKIDRSFVRDMLVDATSGAIAQTIISLGRAMGLPVIAEGVETEEQRDFLAGLGCHSFQGYLFSRPLPLKEFQLLLEEPREGMERVSHITSRR